MIVFGQYLAVKYGRFIELEIKVKVMLLYYVRIKIEMYTRDVAYMAERKASVTSFKVKFGMRGSWGNLRSFPQPAAGKLGMSYLSVSDFWA